MTLLVLLIKGCKSPAFDQAHESPPPAFTLSGWTCADGRRTRIKHGELVYSLIKGYPQGAPISGRAQAGTRCTAAHERTAKQRKNKLQSVIRRVNGSGTASRKPQGARE